MCKKSDNPNNNTLSYHTFQDGWLISGCVDNIY